MGSGLTSMTGGPHEESEDERMTPNSTNFHTPVCVALYPVHAMMARYAHAEETSLIRMHDAQIKILEVILDDSPLRQAFLAFLLSESLTNCENLLFYESVTEVANHYKNEDIDRIMNQFILTRNDSKCSMPTDKLDTLRMLDESADTEPRIIMAQLIEASAIIAGKLISRLEAFYRSEYYLLWLRFERYQLSKYTPVAAFDNTFLILLAEDSPTIYKVISKLLFAKGYTVEIAKNGKEALDKLLSKRYSLAILDMMMPEKTGEQVTIEYREYEPLILARNKSYKRLTIVGMTAFTDAALLEQGITAGMDECLRKPFEINRVIDLMFKFNGMYHLAVEGRPAPIKTRLVRVAPPSKPRRRLSLFL